MNSNNIRIDNNYYLKLIEIDKKYKIESNSKYSIMKMMNL